MSITQSLISHLENEVEILEGEMLRVEEKDCWTMDALKIEELSGDAKCFNQAKKQDIDRLREEIRSLKQLLTVKSLKQLLTVFG